MTDPPRSACLRRCSPPFPRAACMPRACTGCPSRTRRCRCSPAGRSGTPASRRASSSATREARTRTSDRCVGGDPNAVINRTALDGIRKPTLCACVGVCICLDASARGRSPAAGCITRCALACGRAVLCGVCAGVGRPVCLARLLQPRRRGVLGHQHRQLPEPGARRRPLARHERGAGLRAGAARRIIIRLHLGSWLRSWRL